MKRNFLVLVILTASLFLSRPVHAKESVPAPQVGVTAVTPDPGIQNVGVSSETGSVTPDSKSQIQEASAAAVEPKTKKKAKAEGPDPKKNSEKSQAEKKAEEKDQAKASKKTEDNKVSEQVRVMRDEVRREMPYLDRMYIRTSITPLRVQQKEAFLQSGEKDLNDLIIRAKSVHTQAKAAYEGINLYHRRVLYALRKLFPEVAFNFNGRSGLLTGEPFTGKDWQMSVRQPLFNGGILWNTFLQEKSSLEASKKQYDKVISDLIFDLSRAYFEYQRTLQTVDEHAAAVEQMKRFYEMSEQKYEQKLIAEIEYLNVQSLYSQMQFDLETAKQEFEIAKLDLQKYLDLSVDDKLNLRKAYDLSGLLEQKPETGKIVTDKAQDLESATRFFGDEKAPDLPKLIDMSYGNRAELQVEAAKLQATRLGERVRWGEFLPKVFLTYERGQLGEAYVDGGDLYGIGAEYNNEPDPKNQWRLMLEMNWNVGGNKVNYTYDRQHQAPSISQYQGPIGSGYTQTTKNGINFGVLDGLDAFVNVKQAEVDKLNQVVELEKAEKQVLQDVKQAFYDYQKALIQARSTAKRAKWRERLKDLAEHRLGRKEVEISEYMQAESDLVRERSDLHKTIKDYYSAKSALNHAIGIQNYLGIEKDHGSK